MITGLNLDETQDYVLKGDTENPTVWKLGAIPSYIFSKIFSSAKQEDTDTLFKVLQVGLRGWENYAVEFKREKKSFLGFDIEIVPLEILGSIPIPHVAEIAKKIIDINQIVEQERKN